MRILLVEDDLKLVELLLKSLRDNGFSACTASSQSDLTAYLDSNENFDLIILDRLLNNYDSKHLIGKIKQKWAGTPVLIFSAISTPIERADLLNMGADDYLGKPFSTQELIARIRVLLRRNNLKTTNYIQIGNLVLDTITRTISVGEKSYALPAKEFLLFRAMAQDSKKIWSRTDLLEYVWGQSSEVETNVVESTITNLRKRLGDLNANIAIKNMRNAGYWIES